MSSLRFDQLLEFDEGDVGLGGGIQIKEPGNLNPTSDDIIQRYGGTSSPEMQWPEEELLGEMQVCSRWIPKLTGSSLFKMLQGRTGSE